MGAVLPLDLRLLGLWPRQPAAVLARVLVPMAASGLTLAAGAGALLFTVRATEYAASPWFLTKMAVVGLAAAGGLRAGLRARRGHGLPGRAAAAASLAAWLLGLVLGRLVGYF